MHLLRFDPIFRQTFFVRFVLVCSLLIENNPEILTHLEPTRTGYADTKPVKYEPSTPGNHKYGKLNSLGASYWFSSTRTPCPPVQIYFCELEMRGGEQQNATETLRASECTETLSSLQNRPSLGPIEEFSLFWHVRKCGYVLAGFVLSLVLLTTLPPSIRGPRQEVRISSCVPV